MTSNRLRGGAVRSRHFGRARVRSRCLTGIGVVLVAVSVLAGCRQDMHDQPKYEPLMKSDFFGDGLSARPLVEGTVARGHLQADEHLYTGKVDGKLVTEFPFPVDALVLRRGQERFGIFCTPCHGQTGRGDGMVVRRGLRRAASFHTDRLREEPAGYFFDVISNGFGAMPDYRAQIPAEDRWAIVAYVRVLQLSQHAGLEDVPASEQASLAAADAGHGATVEAH